MFNQMIEILLAAKDGNAEWRAINPNGNSEWETYTERNAKEFNLVGYEFRLKEAV